MRRLTLVLLLGLTACGGGDQSPNLVYDPDAGAWVEQQPTLPTDAGTVDAGEQGASDAGTPGGQGACPSGTRCGYTFRYYGIYEYCWQCKMLAGNYGLDIACDDSGNTCVEGETCGAGACASSDEWVVCAHDKGTVINGGATCHAYDGAQAKYVDLPCECR